MLLIYGWFICLLAAVFYSYDFFIRVAPSVMLHSLEKDFSIGTTGVGFLSSAYFYTYIIFQIPAGIILDKYNIKWVISGAMFLCVLGNFVFSIAPDFTIAFVGRLLMGAGSAFGFIGAAKLASMWLPSRFFSFFIGLTTVIGLMGGLVTDTVMQSLVTQFGWRLGNNIFTVIGAGLFIMMLIFIKKHPEYEASKTGSNSLRQRLSELWIIIKEYRFWVISFISGTLFIPINVLASLWGIDFIRTKFNVSSSVASELNSLLFIGTAVGCVIVSFISAKSTRYRFYMMFSCISIAILSSAIIFLPMPLWLFIGLFSLLGVCVGPQVLTFGFSKAVCPKEATATAVAGVNMNNNLIAVILLPLFGWLLTLAGVHKVDHHVVSTVQEYYLAMSMVPILMIVSFPLCLLLPKHVKKT